ncbi:MAG: cyclopropane fatty acyl phospholipid synthase [Chlamydiae bacterium]|nr:cyclopropane fatty acyl phospholipid synthase [Chlamydiota bacterium]
MKKVLFVLLCASVALIWWGKSGNTSAKSAVTEILKEAGIEIDGKKPYDITVYDEAFYPEVLANGSLGLGETYMANMWDAKRVDQFIYKILTAKIEDTSKWQRALQYMQAKLFNLQSKSLSKEVIDIHYNLGNQLYEKMLGPSMAYSCGYWKNAKNLDEAQYAKYDLICRKLKLEKGMKIVDIGCGFGGFAKYAAEKYKVSVLGITLSENQAAYAKKLCANLDVEIRIQDYRDLQGSFDRVVSIGMFEHVGPKNYDEFMQVADRVLKDGGLFLLHTIGKNESSDACDPWIRKYIFPGGVLPSIAQIATASENRFIMEDWHNFGPDYDKTLMAWHANFNQNWNMLSQDYSPTFFRMWNYYLLGCAAAFRARDCQLWQIVFSKNRLAPQYQRET